ncbi:hypothetical protein L596_029256 [Steinernema carpocapsae]|uniref:Protein kinase domain-containing protein n=1 Tax=Steinernema carpocapsae TaxID=34508 RepID=A0A4U5LU41_STECR|nr:hypothetical protein L596_029256 [Steinernema carpocapsae]
MALSRFAKSITSITTLQFHVKEKKKPLDLEEELKRHLISLKKGTIGKGSFSKVRLGFSRKLNRNIAIKEIDKEKNSEFTRKYLPNELQIVRLVNHDNVIRVYDILEFGNTVCIFQEYAENGDLLGRIEKKKRIDEIEGRFLFRQLIEGLRYLESIHVVHRDIKCENLFLDRFDNLKIGDFGFATFLRHGESTKVKCGTAAYSAPEVHLGQSYKDSAVDIWSAGVVLYTMLNGKMPFDDRSGDILSKQLRQDIFFDRARPISYMAELLIKQLLHPKPTRRPSLKSIISCRWLENTRYMIRGWVEEGAGDLSDCSTASEISVGQ